MTTHNYTRSNLYWGHNLGPWHTEDKGLHVSAMGIGSGIRENDFILVSTEGYDTTRYVVGEIHYRSDPPDLWKAELIYAPRSMEEIKADALQFGLPDHSGNKVTA